MAEEILNCDGNDTIYKMDWSNIVGDKTLDDGGYFGDLLDITREHLEDAKYKGELQEADAGSVYSQAIIEAMKEAIEFETSAQKSQLEICLLRAQIDKLRAETAEVYASTIREDCKAETYCEVERNMADSKISLNAAQENKLACECCNDSKRTEGQIIKWECDCDNSSRVTNAQAELYERQVAGFNDNANQKIYDTQMNAWAMVFADQEDIGILDDSLNQENIGISFNRIQDRLNAAALKESQEL